ncbi:hypothetical protein EXE48_12130 [Halorubrum sp. ASP1]|uniref:hypothetical protein n=1 Tax=Halorubrum sp. ASP1 TaxID=2518114 RepID=UPI0010F7B3DE|nr:hypothetical protein [Halorubrum sp. ASP1]TKX60713.1 hypothetical protein EXE48_12130 [Halorubrum sp. ASP1]
MSAKTAHQEFTPHNGSHESETEYSQSIEDFTVPEPVAELTGIDDLSEYNGFEHRGEVFMASVVVSDVRHALFFEHSHAGEEPDPQTPITPHAAIDRTLSQLASTFDSWFEADPTGYGKTTSGHSASQDEIYSNLYIHDALCLRETSSDVYYCREAHREIVVSAIAFLLSSVHKHANADHVAQKQATRKELRKVVVERVSDDLARDEALQLVNDAYDQLDSSSD